MNFLAEIGSRAIGRARYLVYITSIACAAVVWAFRPSSWRRTVREVLARQILFTGIEGMGFISLIALLVGVSVVVQAQLWLNKMGQLELLGPVLVVVVIREIGPLLTNMAVIGRSGSAIATELGNMRVNGEVRMLDAQGLDPFPYIVLPRVVGITISVCCLAILFVAICLLGGFASGSIMGAHSTPFSVFVDTVAKAIQPRDVLNFLAKTIIPGLLTGSICCAEGLSVEGAVTDVPVATTRALVNSVAGLFIWSALISLLTYA